MKASVVKASAVALPDLEIAGVRALPAHAVGLGLRRALIAPLLACDADAIDFIECAPENWIGLGGALGESLDALAARWPLTCHGLSLSLGGVDPLDEIFLQRVRGFLDRHRVPLYSEHLSYCTGEGHLYDLLPLPFTDEAVLHVAARIRRTQDILGRRIAVENASYYQTVPVDHDQRALTEVQFVTAVLDEAGCDLLLDVNNVFVNAINHRYDAYAFIDAMPPDRVVCQHVAGHYDQADDLKVDTHGTAVKDAVWELLEYASARFGPRPTLLERDFNIPAFDELAGELQRVRNALGSRERSPPLYAHG